MFNIWWRALTPGLRADEAVVSYQVLLEAEPNPTLAKGALWTLVAALIANLMQAPVTLILFFLQAQQSPPAEGTGLGLCLGLLFAPIVSVVGFVVSSAMLWVAARVLGGRGTLNRQAYVQAAVQAPLVIVFAGYTALNLLVSSLLPEAGVISGCIGLLFIPLAIYLGWISLMALRAAHGYGGVQALLTGVLAGGVLALGSFCATSVLTGLFQG